MSREDARYLASYTFSTAAVLYTGIILTAIGVHQVIGLGCIAYARAIEPRLRR